MKLKMTLRHSSKIEYFFVPQNESSIGFLDYYYYLFLLTAYRMFMIMTLIQKKPNL